MWRQLNFIFANWQIVRDCFQSLLKIPAQCNTLYYLKYISSVSVTLAARSVKCESVFLKSGKVMIRYFRTTFCIIIKSGVLLTAWVSGFFSFYNGLASNAFLPVLVCCSNPLNSNCFRHGKWKFPWAFLIKWITYCKKFLEPYYIYSDNVCFAKTITDLLN